MVWNILLITFNSLVRWYVTSVVSDENSGARNTHTFLTLTVMLMKFSAWYTTADVIIKPEGQTDIYNDTLHGKTAKWHFSREIDWRHRKEGQPLLLSNLLPTTTWGGGAVCRRMFCFLNFWDGLKQHFQYVVSCTLYVWTCEIGMLCLKTSKNLCESTFAPWNSFSFFFFRLPKQQTVQVVSKVSNTVFRIEEHPTSVAPCDPERRTGWGRDRTVQQRARWMATLHSVLSI